LAKRNKLKLRETMLVLGILSVLLSHCFRARESQWAALDAKNDEDLSLPIVDLRAHEAARRESEKTARADSMGRITGARAPLQEAQLEAEQDTLSG
jgi:hypothetical protein